MRASINFLPPPKLVRRRRAVKRPARICCEPLQTLEPDRWFLILISEIRIWRRPTMRIIDADGHVLERDIPWADLIDAPYRSRAPAPSAGQPRLYFHHDRRKTHAETSRQRLSFVGAPRSHSAAADDGHGRSQAAAQGHGFGRHRHRGALRHVAVSEPAVRRRQRFGQRRGARLQQLAGRLLQRRSAPAKRRGRGRDSGPDGSGQGASPRG